MFKNSSSTYYVDNKEGYKRVCKRCQSVSKEEKEKRQQYVCERYKNLSEDEKQELF